MPGYRPHSSTQSQTVAGATSNSNASSIGMNNTKLNFAPRYGVVVDVRLQGKTLAVPFVRLRWVADNSLANTWVPLEDHPNLISAVYAARLEDLIGYTIKVMKRSATDATGIGRIVADTTFDQDKYDPELPSSGVKI